MISMLSSNDFNIKVCYQASLCIKDRYVAIVINPEIVTYRDNVIKDKELAMIVLLSLTISRLI
jgi:hypothetical protein